MRFAVLVVPLILGARPGAAQPPDWTRYSVMTPAGPDETPPEVFRKVSRLVYGEHKILKGEYSAWHLAKIYGTTATSLQTTNNDEMLILYPGKKVIVHNYKNAQLYEIKKASETLDHIVSKWYKNPREALLFRQQIVLANKLPGSAMLGDYEFLKGARVLLPNVRMNWDNYQFPFPGRMIFSSGFGFRRHPLQKQRKFHEGLDIPKPWGTAVFPSRSGKVIEAGWTEGYGMLLVIRHRDGATTRYGHLSKIFVKVGQEVQRGRTLIGRVGSTGLSTGPHLHFEVRDKNGKPVNPRTKIGHR